MLKKIFIIIGLLILKCSNIFAYSFPNNLSSTTDDTIGNYRFTLMPEKHLIPLFTADSRTHRLSICNVLGSREFIGGMGGVFPVFNIGNKKNQVLEFSVASTLYTTLTRYQIGGALLNTDFFVDLFLDAKLNDRFFLRSGAGHTSQHLSDDGVKRYSPINYVRDYFQLFGVYQFPKQNGMIYGGIVFNHNLKVTDATNAYDLSNTPMYQFGFEHVPFQICKYGYLYWAGDIKFRGEVNYGSTKNIQAGVKWMNENKKTIRLAANYGWGYDERGQFYFQTREYFYLGLYFDF